MHAWQLQELGLGSLAKASGHGVALGPIPDNFARG